MRRGERKARLDNIAVIGYSWVTGTRERLLKILGITGSGLDGTTTAS